jgi:hypothetical protein
MSFYCQNLVLSYVHSRREELEGNDQVKNAGGVIGSAGTEVLPGGFDWNDERMDGMDLGMRVEDCP